MATTDVAGIISVDTGNMPPKTFAAVSEFGTVARIQEALNGLSTIGGAGGSVWVTSDKQGTYQIDLLGSLAGKDDSLITVDTSNLAAGITGSVREYHSSIVTALSQLSTIGGANGGGGSSRNLTRESTRSSSTPICSSASGSSSPRCPAAARGASASARTRRARNCKPWPSPAA